MPLRCLQQLLVEVVGWWWQVAVELRAFFSFSLSLFDHFCHIVEKQQQQLNSYIEINQVVLFGMSEQTIAVFSYMNPNKLEHNKTESNSSCRLSVAYFQIFLRDPSC